VPGKGLPVTGRGPGGPLFKLPGQVQVTRSSSPTHESRADSDGVGLGSSCHGIRGQGPPEREQSTRHAIPAGPGRGAAASNLNAALSSARGTGQTVRPGRPGLSNRGLNRDFRVSLSEAESVPQCRQAAAAPGPGPGFLIMLPAAVRHTRLVTDAGESLSSESTATRKSP
jgi:hypothetical protein